MIQTQTLTHTHIYTYNPTAAGTATFQQHLWSSSCTLDRSKRHTQDHTAMSKIQRDIQRAVRTQMKVSFILPDMVQSEMVKTELHVVC